jgi:hypothetical protein
MYKALKQLSKGYSVDERAAMFHDTAPCASAFSVA